MLRVELLGSLAFRLNGGQRLSHELGPQGRLVAGYLFSSPGKIHKRERLAEMFWDHLDDPERARCALNTALWRIRKIMAHEPNARGECSLVGTGMEVVFEPADWLDVDVVQFENAAKSVLAAQGCQVSDRIRDLERVLCSYVAPFLESEYADWVIERRERIHSKFVRVAIELLQLQAQTQHIAEAIDVARQILSLDPFRESVYRDLLILLAVNGERAEAIRTHKRWTASLQAELDVSPMPATEALVRDIRAGQVLTLEKMLSAGSMRSNA